jgi:hypothetical protein
MNKKEFSPRVEKLLKKVWHLDHFLFSFSVFDKSPADLCKEAVREALREFETYKETFSGRGISLDEFLGPGFDHKKKTLVRVDMIPVKGYAQAFAQPPYPLEMTEEEKNKLFLQIFHEVFHDFKERFVIYSWDTNWSSYFDQGKEWWGAQLWTVLLFERQEIVVVGASTTD